ERHGQADQQDRRDVGQGEADGRGRDRQPRPPGRGQEGRVEEQPEAGRGARQGRLQV
ncbi:MAG: hypothetical protein AVDCRST_MAG52-1118, partial [uncultured Blastococcus sp.]